MRKITRKAIAAVMAITAITALIALGSAATADTIYENSQHTMAAGDFGVAYMNGAGDILVTNGSDPPSVLLTGVSATHVLGADLTGDGTDELLYVSGTQLYYYNFGTTASTDTGNGGTGINDISAGKFGSGDAFDTAFVAFNGGISTFKYTAAVGYATLSSGEILSATRGDFATGNGVDEFATSNTTTDPWFYEPATTTWSTPGNSDWHRFVAGNLTAAAGDEVLLATTPGDVWIAETPLGAINYLNEPAGGVTKLAIGNIDGNVLDEGYVIATGSPLSQIWQYDGGTWNDTFAGNNAGFVDMILADVDSDGLDELFALRANGELYRFDYGTAGFQLVVPEPSTFILAAFGLLGLLGCAVRRRRRVA